MIKNRLLTSKSSQYVSNGKTNKTKLCISLYKTNSLYIHTYIHTHIYTVIPRLTSDPANDFSANEDVFAFSDSANEYGFG
jgi:hypothetical protein